MFRLLPLLFALAASAQAAPHTHGEAQMEVVIEGPRLEITLELPLDVAVGFERAPRNAAEKEALAAAHSRLGDAASVFLPSAAAACALDTAQVQLPDFAKGGEAHADIVARYVFRCAKPEALRGVETRLFSHFKRLYRIEARRIGPAKAGQGAQRLAPKQAVLSW